MTLTEQQLLDNWNLLIAEIEESITGDRKNKLIDLYNTLQDNMMYAPASGFEHYHNCFPGGYVDHVNRVVKCARNIYNTWLDMGLAPDSFTIEELVFVALNHDLGKMGDLNHELYVANESEWHRIRS